LGVRFIGARHDDLKVWRSQWKMRFEAWLRYSATGELKEVTPGPMLQSLAALRAKSRLERARNAA
jgi:hypothetical protein